jgi:hypothetical protein
MYFIGRGEYQGLNLLCLAELGWHALCREGWRMAWINDWAPHQGSMDGKDRPVMQQGFDLFWNDAPLQSVMTCYPLFREGAANATRKVLSRH